MLRIMLKYLSNSFLFLESLFILRPGLKSKVINMFQYQNIEQIYTITCSKLLKKQAERSFSFKNFQNLKEIEIIIVSEPKEQIIHSFLHVNNIFHYFALSTLPMLVPGNFHIKNKPRSQSLSDRQQDQKHNFQVSVRLLDLKRLNTQQIHLALSLSLKAHSHLSLLFGFFVLFCLCSVFYLFFIFCVSLSSIIFIIYNTNYLSAFFTVLFTLCYYFILQQTL